MGQKIDVNSVEKIIAPILKRHGIKKAGLFGSITQGKLGKNSDVDILVDFRGNKSLLDLVGLELELEKKLGKKVDLLTYKSINPLLKKRILSEEVRVL